MSRVNERTLQMKQGFMTLHNEGLSIEEIAEKYNLSGKTVRNHLSDIAKANGVKRDDLLKIPHRTHLTYERQFEPVKEVDVSLYNKKFDALEAAGQELSSLISEYIREQEAII